MYSIDEIKIKTLHEKEEFHCELVKVEVTFYLESMDDVSEYISRINTIFQDKFIDDGIEATR